MNENDNKELKKQTFWLRVTGICALTVAVCIIIFTVGFMDLKNNVEEQITEVAGEVEKAIEDSDDTIKMINNAAKSLEDMGSEVEEISKSLKETGLQAVYDTLDNINKINIGKLNDSIDSLNNIISPLARLFGK